MSSELEDKLSGLIDEHGNEDVLLAMIEAQQEVFKETKANLVASLQAMISLAEEAVAVRIASDDPEDNDGDLIALYQQQISDGYAAIAQANGIA